MRGLSLFRLCAVALLAPACFCVNASAEILQNLGADNVATTYTYPQGMNPGVLSLNDQSLGVIATFIDNSQINLSDVALTLSVNLNSEGGNPADALAHGIFGGGVLTLADTTPMGPDITLFQANLTGFELTEVIPGAYAGQGAFTNATYGGALSAVTLPTSGDFVTSLFTWHTGGFNGPVVDIDNFLTAPEGDPTIFADMHDVNIFPEPGAAAMALLLAGWAIRRRRQA